MAKSQGHLEPPEREEVRHGFSLEPSEGLQPCRHLDFRLLDRESEFLWCKPPSLCGFVGAAAGISHSDAGLNPSDPASRFLPLSPRLQPLRLPPSLQFFPQQWLPPCCPRGYSLLTLTPPPVPSPFRIRLSLLQKPFPTPSPQRIVHPPNGPGTSQGWER